MTSSPSPGSNLPRLFADIHQLLTAIYPGCRDLQLTFTTVDGRAASMPVQPLIWQEPVVSVPAPPPARATHSPDFRSVNFYGHLYRFSPTQAAIVAELWRAWEEGNPEIGQAALLEAADAASRSLRDVFRRSPAWGVLILAGEGPGTFRLASIDEHDEALRRQLEAS